MEQEKRTLTTAFGIPVPDDLNSLTAGERGPVLMQDAHLLEKLGHFDRERIPERVVHAKGAGAYGYFEVTADVTRYTHAKFLSEIRKKTEVFVRFSTVGGEKGSVRVIQPVLQLRHFPRTRVNLFAQSSHLLVQRLDLPLPPLEFSASLLQGARRSVRLALLARHVIPGEDSAHGEEQESNNVKVMPGNFFFHFVPRHILKAFLFPVKRGRRRSSP